MSLFAAARLYVVCADRSERDLAALDGGSVPPLNDAAWALWSKLGASAAEADPLAPTWRVQPGPVHLAQRRSAPPSSPPVDDHGPETASDARHRGQSAPRMDARSRPWWPADPAQRCRSACRL